MKLENWRGFRGLPTWAGNGFSPMLYHLVWQVSIVLLMHLFISIFMGQVCVRVCVCVYASKYKHSATEKLIVCPNEAHDLLEVSINQGPGWGLLLLFRCLGRDHINRTLHLKCDVLCMSIPRLPAPCNLTNFSGGFGRWCFAPQICQN